MKTISIATLLALSALTTVAFADYTKYCPQPTGSFSYTPGGIGPYTGYISSNGARAFSSTKFLSTDFGNTTPRLVNQPIQNATYKFKLYSTNNGNNYSQLIPDSSGSRGVLQCFYSYADLMPNNGDGSALLSTEVIIVGSSPNQSIRPFE